MLLLAAVLAPGDLGVGVNRPRDGRRLVRLLTLVGEAVLLDMVRCGRGVHENALARRPVDVSHDLLLMLHFFDRSTCLRCPPHLQIG